MLLGHIVVVKITAAICLVNVIYISDARNNLILWILPKSGASIVADIVILIKARVRPEMQKAADAADISVQFFSACANFWAVWGHF